MLRRSLRFSCLMVVALLPCSQRLAGADTVPCPSAPRRVTASGTISTGTPPSPIILDLAPCEQAEIALTRRTAYRGGALGSLYFRTASGEVLQSDDPFFVWPPLPEESVATFLKLGRTFEGSRLYQVDIGPYDGGTRDFSYDFDAWITPRLLYNDAGESLAEARPLPIPTTAKGNLRGIDPGHYYKVFLQPGKQLPLRMVLRHGPHFLSSVAYVDVYDGNAARIGNGSLLGRGLDFQTSEATDETVFENSTGVAQWFTFHIWNYFGSEQRELIYWLCFGDAPCVADSVCGDGMVEGAEQCDDGNSDPDDGCDGSCGIDTARHGRFKNHIGCAATTHGTPPGLLGPLVEFAISTAVTLGGAAATGGLAIPAIGVGLSSTILVNNLLVREDFSRIARGSPNWTRGWWFYDHEGPRSDPARSISIKEVNLQFLTSEPGRSASKVGLRIWDPRSPRNPKWEYQWDERDARGPARHGQVLTLRPGQGLPRRGIRLRRSRRGAPHHLQVTLAVRFDEEGADPWCAMTTNLEIPAEGEHLAEEEYAENLSEASWYLDEWIHNDLRGRWGEGSFAQPHPDGSCRPLCTGVALGFSEEECLERYGSRCHKKRGGPSCNVKGRCYSRVEDGDSTAVLGVHGYSNHLCRQHAYHGYPEPPPGHDLQYAPDSATGPSCGALSASVLPSAVGD